ncbi:DUF1003 domain-containing protein [Paracoccus sp. (in: a-proteobacteria)]|uniref:DUF1003 domain-containing protein n=1 Tax=Paracoccus sp. TaxID=267 RepID=UPI0026DFDFFE|nr:DUF1003 domain-containing protein [Paracoccus sp. (in: a-proteobacteria)]MDO5368869.1 DUF1003 domain-containing protein [Paracoccus sp. (in: a-proteobacteria)]
MNRTVEDLAHRWLSRAPEGLSGSEHRVLESSVRRRPIARDTAGEYGTGLTFGQRLADGVARFGGSWPFILWFAGLLLLWIVGNKLLLGRAAFGPYPFIFLNLILSMLAAIQAPVIMMSQNRQAQRDRIDAAHDYEVNLKAEIEIMALHEKLDELRHSELLAMREDIARMAWRLDDLARNLEGSSGDLPVQGLQPDR